MDGIYMHIAGIKIDELSEKDAIIRIGEYIRSNAQHHIVSVNPEGVLLAQRDKNYRDILNHAALGLVDGMGVVLAIKILYSRFQIQDSRFQRITGIDLMLKLCEMAMREDWRVYLVGGVGKTAMIAAERLRTRFPGLQIEGEEGILHENQKSGVPSGRYSELIERINVFKPQLLFVALGQPKQEFWIDEYMREMPSVRVAMGVGGAFDFIAGNVARAPAIWRKIGIEWFWRLMVQPWRLPRIVNATIRYAALVVRERLKR